MAWRHHQTPAPWGDLGVRFKKTRIRRCTMARLLQAWLWLREKGQGLVEYALILVLVAVVVIVVLTLLGTRVSAVFSRIASALGGS